MTENGHLRASAEPEDVGLSAVALERIRSGLDEQLAGGEIPGAVAIVQRAGQVAWVATVGDTTVDSIFRIYSMTKPLTSVAAAILAEEGLFDLRDPIGRWLPELDDLSVVSDASDGRMTTEPAERPITVIDLLRLTSGFAGSHGSSPRMSAHYRHAGIVSFEHTSQMAHEYSPEHFVSALASVPLAHQPGTVWEYGCSGDVLGIVLEKVAGQPLDVILRDRLCRPLGLRDTGLFVPPEHAGRVVQPLTRFEEGATLIDLTAVPRFRFGGSGCYSTAADYLCFARMLLSGGESGRRDAGGRPVLTRKSLDLIMTDQLGPLAGTGPDYIPGPGYTFGLGMALGRPGLADSARGVVAQDAWWLGRASTSFFVDPRQELIGVLMTQRYWQARHYQEWFKDLVYRAIM